jgi:hypothetical protein
VVGSLDGKCGMKTLSAFLDLEIGTCGARTDAVLDCYCSD